MGEELTGHPAVHDLVAASLPGRTVLVSSGRDGARVRDASTGQPIGAAPLPVGDGPAAIWLPDGRLMVGSGTSEGGPPASGVTPPGWRAPRRAPCRRSAAAAGSITTTPVSG